MKVGDLVKRIDNWVKYNPWMGDTLMSDNTNSNEVFGIIIKAPAKVQYEPSILVLWATLGVMKEHPDDIEVVDDHY